MVFIVHIMASFLMYACMIWYDNDSAMSSVLWHQSTLIPYSLTHTTYIISINSIDFPEFSRNYEVFPGAQSQNCAFSIQAIWGNCKRIAIFLIHYPAFIMLCLILFDNLFHNILSLFSIRNITSKPTMRFNLLEIYSLFWIWLKHLIY